MSKAILVMDMPDVCYDCPLCENDSGCMAVGNSLIEVFTDREKPEWCPLKPLPEKAELTFVDHGQDQIAMGWNSCIDELLKGGES